MPDLSRVNAAWQQGRGVIPQPILFGGGLDIETPPFSLKPGFCRSAQNFYQSIYGGYTRTAGYERFDGRAKPSDATYTILAATITGAPAVGNTLVGATSGATGYIIALPGSQFVLTQVVGTFVSGENLNVGAGTIAVSTAGPVIGGASTRKLHAQYRNLAADVYRALIQKVPGEGRILGVNHYRDPATNTDRVYAFRNAVGGATAAMYKSTTSGWTLVALGRELLFTSGGNTEIAEGATITGATSGATAVLKRASLRSGTYAASSGVGSFFFATVTGLFQNGENLQVGGVTKAVANGADAAITLLPDGHYEFVNANFTGSTNTKRMYGCDGVNKAFEFDGTTFVKIYTGMTTDAPTHIMFHLYHLFLSFYGSVQFSSTGLPYQWTPVTGSGELAMGDTITGFAVQPAGTSAAALAVFTQGRLSILYGSTSSTFQLVPYKDEIGAVAFTMQNLAQTIFLDLQGVTDIATTQAFGNFSHATLSNAVKSTLAGWRSTAIASSVSRDLNQYRLFFTNNYALYFTMIGTKVIGIMPMLFTDSVRCTAQGILADNTEASYFGSDNGYVYQLDKGTSFDGADIEAYFNLAYNFSGSQRRLKRYRGGALEIAGSGYSEFNFGYSLGYGSTDIIQPGTETIVTNFSNRTWDDGGNWETGVWDGMTLTPSSFEMDGEAENVSVAITSVGDYFERFTISGGVLHISPRRELR